MAQCNIGTMKPALLEWMGIILNNAEKCYSSLNSEGHTFHFKDWYPTMCFQTFQTKLKTQKPLIYYHQSDKQVSLALIVTSSERLAVL